MFSVEGRLLEIKLISEFILTFKPKKNSDNTSSCKKAIKYRNYYQFLRKNAKELYVNLEFTTIVFVWVE